MICNKKFLVLTILTWAISALTFAQDVPYFAPTVEFTHPDGSVTTDFTPSGSGPIVGMLKANPQDYDGWIVMCEWNFVREGEEQSYLVRYEEETEVTFSDYGKTNIYCIVKFINGNDTISYDKEYWDENIGPMSVAVAESKLEMPNAFSPNGDEFNEIYKPKSNYQSIVEFHAIIVNRNGQKLFEWDDPSTGWDGTYNGRPVPDGVYYCMVKAKGADGVKWNIRKDVNLLRGFNETVKEGE